jgi:adenylylsulfate kinase
MRVRSSGVACCYWLTGLPAAGKSTLANSFGCILKKQGITAYVADGNILREGMNRDLGYTRDDRAESVRRVAELASYLVDAGFVVVVALVSPYAADRQRAREWIGPARFFEVFVDATLGACIERDPKGLYRQAREGSISHFTGISDPYEIPVSPDLHIDTEGLAIAQGVSALVNHYTCLHVAPAARRTDGGLEDR